MNKKICPWLLVGISVAAAVYLRTYAVTMPQLSFAAEREIFDRERETVRKSVRDAYPGILPDAGSRMADKLFEARLKEERLRIERDVVRRAEELKGRYRDAQGHAYLNGIDSYYWLRLLQNLLEKGHIGDRAEGGVEYDDLIAAPIEAPLARSAHLWLGLLFYKSAALFYPSVPLETALFYIPIFLSVFIAFFSYRTAKALGAGDLGAFAASFAITFSPIFLTRSAVEWFDTDIYSVLFPLLSFGMFLGVFSQQRTARRMLSAALAAVFLGLYASTWKGWWFIFDLQFISGLLFVLNQKLSQEETGVKTGVLKGNLVSLAFFFIFAGISVVTLNGVAAWKDCFIEPLRLATILDVTPKAAWPNVYQTVAELGPVKSGDMIRLLGGHFVFLTALAAVLYLFLVERAARDERFGFGLLCLIFWIIATFYAGLAASRFVLLLVVPVGFAFGLGIDRAWRWLTADLGPRLRIPSSVVSLAAMCCFCIYIASAIWDAHLKVQASSTPAMDDYWQEVLVKIKKETPKEAVINSWWDFGHWFKAVAQRRVLFDGMTQNTPYAYWIAHALLAQDEKEALAILSMINGRGNRAADILEHEVGFPAASAVGAVRRALRMSKQEARSYLIQQGAPSARLNELLDAIFPAIQPDAYFIVSYDMPAKIGPISYIGNWNFERVDMWFKRSRFSKADFFSYLMAQYRLTKDEAQARDTEMAFLHKEESRAWFSRVLGYASGLSSSRRDGKILIFDNGLVVNEENRHAFVASEFAGRRGVPQSLVFLSEDGDTLKEETQKESTLPYSALLIPDKTKEYRSLLLDTDFAKSMLVRLYYFSGQGLKYFKLFHKVEDDKGNAIFVYRVEWPLDTDEV